MENYKLLKTIFSVVLLSGFLSSCKNADTIGVAMQPPGDQLHLMFTDTNELVTTTVRDAPLITSSTTIEINQVKNFVNLLGTYNDPVFGTSQASFYTQFLLSDSLKIVPVLSKDLTLIETGYDKIKVDSVILSLGYYSYYGDTNAHNIEVYRLTGTIDRLTSYSPNATFQYDTLLAHTSFKPSLLDSVIIGGHKEAPQLKMRLMSLESKIQNSIQSSPNNSVGDLSNIISGIYVRSTTDFASGEGSIVSFNLGSPSTYIGVYYHFNAHFSNKDKSIQRDTVVNMRQNLVVNGACARVTNLSNDSSATLSHAIAVPHTGDSVLFLKSMGVSKVKILMPYLNAYFYKGFIVNKAELQVYVEPSTAIERKFPPANYLEISRIGDLNESAPIADKLESSSYGGFYNSSGAFYSFIITRHVQSLMNGKLKNNGLYLEFGTEQKTANAGRVVLIGGKRSNRRMRLLLTYTKI
jgi:hypothetical protein